MNTHKNILIVIYSNSQFNEMNRVIDLILSSNNFTATIFFQFNYNYSYSLIKQQLTKKNIKHFFAEDVLKLNCEPKIEAKQDTLSRKIFHKSMRLILHSKSLSRIFLFKPVNDILISTLVYFYNWLSNSPHSREILPLSPLVKNIVLYTEKIFNSLSFDLLILPEENVTCLSQYFIKRAKEKDISTLIIPYSISNPREFYESFYNVSRYDTSTLLNRYIVKRYPCWAKKYKGKTLTFASDHMLFYEKNKLTPPNPWLVDSGFATAIAVDSIAMKKNYLKFGVDSSKLILTGSLFDDDAYKILINKERHKHQLCASLNLPLNKPIILCAMPPNVISSYRNPTGFSTYANLVQFWVSELKKFSNKFNVIINLHPNITSEEISAVDFLDLSVSNEKVAHLIPLSDLYVASISSTIRFAIGCGIPVINYDVYQYRYEDYDAAKGVVRVESQEDFSTALSKILTNDLNYLQLKNAQLEGRHNWAMGDGNSGARLLKLFDTLSA